MNFSAHQVAGGIVDQTVASHRILAGEDSGDDEQLVVATFPGAGMPGVAMRFVFDADGLRLQGGQSLAKQFDGFLTQAGKTFLKGLTVTFS